MFIPSSSTKVPGISGLVPFFGAGYALTAPGSETCAAADNEQAMSRVTAADLIMFDFISCEMRLKNSFFVGVAKPFYFVALIYSLDLHSRFGSNKPGPVA